MFADAIMAFSGGKLTVTGPTATAGIFCTYPADYLSVWGGVVDQVRPPLAVMFPFLSCIQNSFEHFTCV